MASRSPAAEGWWRPSTELATAVALLGIFAAGPAVSSHDRDIVDAVRTYVARFEQEASALVAEEHYTQAVGSETRIIRSDFVLVKPSETGPWLGYRDVFEVDGAEVRERNARLLQILETTAPDSLQRAERLTMEGARFHLGPPRTVNAPTVPLELLASRNRDRIRLRPIRELRDGTGRMLLAFDEQRGSTIVRAMGRGRVKSSGEIIARPDGAIVGAMLLFRFDAETGPDIDFNIRVHYTEVPGIAVLLPESMTEQFGTGAGSGTGKALYFNYRRFQTSARIR